MDPWPRRPGHATHPETHPGSFLTQERFSGLATARTSPLVEGRTTDSGPRP